MSRLDEPLKQVEGKNSYLVKSF